MSVVSIVVEAAGVAIVSYTLRDVFRDIFHPTRSGSLSDFVGRTASKLFRHTRLRPAIGAGALVGVIVLWGAFVALGFACIYYPLFPRQLDAPGATDDFADHALRSLYASMGALGTFQIFDVETRVPWIRVIVGMEGLIGISLITASVSWLVLLYPALERTRFLAKRTFLLVQAREKSGVEHPENERLVCEMADRVVQARIDLILFPILLNFYPPDRNQTLALALPHLQALADRCIAAECAVELRFSAMQLREALLDFSQMLCERVLEGNPKEMTEAFRAFAALDD